MKPEVTSPPLRDNFRLIAPTLVGCIDGVVVSIAVCQFIQSDANRHADDHVRTLELRWNSLGGCK